MPEESEKQFSCQFKGNVEFYTMGNNEQITAIPNDVRTLRLSCYKS